MGITQIYAQQPCHQCNGTAFYIGTNTGASGPNSFAGGNSSTVTSTNGFVFGNESSVTGLNGIALGNNALVNFANGIAIGSYAKSNATNSYVFGQYLNGTGSNSLTFGIGASSSLPLVNKISNSIMFGVTNLPSLAIVKPTNGTIGYIGIGTEDPEEMAHVMGNLLIERTDQTSSSLRFKHPTPSGTIPGSDDNIFGEPYYCDIHSDVFGLKFNTIDNNGISQSMIIGKEGSVGIGAGITFPKAKLHVDNNILANGDITTLDKIILAPEYNLVSKYWEISRTNAGLNYAYKDKKSSQNILFMGNDGSVGIGKTNPTATLDVNGSFKATSADIAGTLSVQTLNAQNLAFDGNTIFNGFVGIFTLNPQAILHLHDPRVLQYEKGEGDTTDLSRGIAKILQITNVNSSGEGFTIHRDPIQSMSALVFKQHDMVPLTIEGPSGGLTIAPNGNVGIGIPTPQAKLDVGGAFKAQSATVNGATTINGALTAQSATVNGATTIHGALTAQSATVNGATTIHGALTAQSATIIETLTANLLKAPKAEIKGKIKAQEVEVTLSGWSDFVFEDDYPLMSLQETEQFIKEHKHLPAVPSAAEVEANGVNLGEMNAILIQKVEELTLYVLDLQKQINELKPTK